MPKTLKRVVCGVCCGGGNSSACAFITVNKHKRKSAVGKQLVRGADTSGADHPRGAQNFANHSMLEVTYHTRNFIQICVERGKETNNKNERTKRILPKI